MNTEQLTMLIHQGENHRVEFKQTVEAINSELLVALANSKNGGVIVVGVIDENNRTPNTAAYVNTPLTDRARLAIQNKAIDCIPPIALSLEQHEVEDMNLVVIDVKSSSSKPHCTSKGLYRIRSDGRNRELQPNELLAIFLEKEESVFLERFKLATDGIMGSVSNLDESTKGQIDAIGKLMHTAVTNFQREVEGLGVETQDIFGFSEDAAMHAEQAVMDLDLAEREIQTRLSRIEDKIDRMMTIE
jgi:Schlafen, AlbA_2